jgi:antitoxin FitA
MQNKLGDSMHSMANIQVRGVPDDVHRSLKSQAAFAGQSLNDFLLARITEMARLPTIPELAGRIRQREPYEGPSVAELIREDRDSR